VTLRRSFPFLDRSVEPDVLFGHIGDRVDRRMALLISVKLSDEEIASLKAPYVPHAVVGFTHQIAPPE
jgi:hypothetical protein